MGLVFGAKICVLKIAFRGVLNYLSHCTVREVTKYAWNDPVLQCASLVKFK